ncbi:MAG: hypothetical protein E3J90_03470 [Promethearchaeota archaeon]|nr:MAG: hypothetical protein E3J90_03470 [Candidatus Lokiarchaeota archaeon]
MNIIDAVNLAKKIHKNGSKLKRNTFAGLINMKEDGGAFRTKVTALKKYGLIEIDGDEISLTRLAKEIVLTRDDGTKKKYMYQAFKNVELFEDFIEKYKKIGKIELEDLNAILELEFNVNQKHVAALKRSIIESLSSLGLLKKDTGELDLTLTQENNETKEVLQKMIIEEETIKLENKDVQKEKQKTDEKLTSILNSDIFNIITTFSSYFKPINSGIEEISKIIKSNENLTHTQVAFNLLKEEIINGTIPEEKLKILLNALKQDLKI